MQFVKRDLGKVVVCSCRPFVDLEFLELVFYNQRNVKTDGTLERLVQRFRSNLPFRRKPASSALHAHSEF